MLEERDIQKLMRADEEAAESEAERLAAGRADYVPQQLRNFNSMCHSLSLDGSYNGNDDAGRTFSSTNS